jgi:hypothetical protein
MALMTHRLVEFSTVTSRLDTDGPSKFGGDFCISSGDDRDGGGPAITRQKSLDSNAVRHRVCLECALPLKTSEHQQGLECGCLQEETEDEWLNVGGWEIAFILGLGIACMAVSFWSCF